MKAANAKRAGAITLLAYSGCTTCKNAMKWLEERKLSYALRPIVLEPPTVSELKRWILASGIPVRKWLNTSGQSYRAIGKEKIDAASDAELMSWLARDGKLVKRPVLVRSGGGGGAGEERVLVGFKPEAYAAELG